MIKIAICDDEKYFVDTVEKMLKIYAEKNGKDFCIKKYTKPLQLMESLKEEFQIFFLDIEMPAMDGMELVDIIRRHDEKSIILYVSSHNEFLGVGYKYDVQNFITKPITQVQINCEMNVMTIFIPLLLNIIVMAVCTDNLYNDKKVIIGNIWSVITRKLRLYDTR